MKDLFSIGELAKYQKISKQTLIFYDKIGLFRPAWVDPDNGYRYYSAAQLDELDAILIMQVLSNLMENAVFHGETTTHIALSAQRDGSWARFYVRDNGQGIPPQKLHTLFSGALRCEDSTPGDGKRNMGLGLSVCMAIIRAHGGTLEAKNLESGAEFSFCLPLIKEDAK